MTTATQPGQDPAGSPPPGWYPDPAGSPAQRYWDGVDWAMPLSATERAARLDAIVAEVVRYGGRVESRTPTQAVVVRGSNTSGGVHVIHFLMTLFTCGLWALVWIAVVALQHEQRQILTVDPYGNVVRN